MRTSPRAHSASSTLKAKDDTNALDGVAFPRTLPQIASPGQVHEHIGSADEGELQVLKATARQRLVAGQDELHLGLERTERLPGAVRAVAPLPITSSQMGVSPACAGLDHRAGQQA